MKNNKQRKVIAVKSEDNGVINERQVAMIKALKDRGSLTVSQLSDILQVSKYTVRTDANRLEMKDKVYYRTNDTGLRYVVLIPDNCKNELYEKKDIGAWIEEQKRLGRKL